MAFLDQTDAMVQRYPTVTLKIFQAKVEHKYFQKHNDTSQHLFSGFVIFFLFFFLCDAISFITFCHFTYFMSLLWKIT